jgi:OmpA-OmpF porin, OOP family
MPSSRSQTRRALGVPPLAALLALPLTAFAQPTARREPAAAAPAPAQPAPPPAPPASPPPDRPLFPFRFDVDLYAGLTYRLGSNENDVVQRGGGLLGLSALAGPPAGLWSAGLGYERSFFGRERIETEDGRFTEIGRGLDALWFLGRVYPYQTDDLVVYATLGLAPAWQRVSASGSTLVNDGSGVIRPRSVSCSASDSAGLGLRLGAGAQLAINEYLGFDASLGVDHLRLADTSLDGCAAGMGSDTFLAARFGFVLTGGRPEAPRVAKAAPSDRDGDRIPDVADACPSLAGVPSTNPAKHGCPPPGDRDADGITDDVDACPVEAGVPSQDPQQHGCPPPPPPPPPDRDGDKVTDAEDACPDIAGVATAEPATNGCPPDTDGDGIRDDKDACREVKGVQSDDPSKNGCPLVVFTEKEIVIAQQVQFETDKAAIRPVSNALLDEVASVIKQHPEIVKIEVQGHTDSTGDKARNKLLSKARAESVRKALVKRGVATKSLDAQGYGQDQPIADNATDDGKTLNRRVQFKILEKK